MAKKRSGDVTEFSESGAVPVVTGLNVYAVTQSTVVLLWNSPDNIDGVALERSSDGEKWAPVSPIGANGGTDGGREPGTEYHYRAYATQGNERSTYSDVVTAKTVEVM
jgi:hypothetical protein